MKKIIKIFALVSSLSICASSNDQELDLSYKRLSSLERLRLEKYPTVTYLSLFNNCIEDITLEDLKGFPNLEVLNLNCNQLKFLNPQVFGCCPRLKKLYLISNRLQPDTIQNLKKALPYIYIQTEPSPEAYEC